MDDNNGWNLEDRYVEQILNQRRETKTFNRNEKKLLFVMDNEIVFREIINNNYDYNDALSRGIISDARNIIEYSPHTVDMDIFRSLLNFAKKYVL